MPIYSQPSPSSLHSKAADGAPGRVLTSHTRGARPVDCAKELARPTKPSGIVSTLCNVPVIVPVLRRIPHEECLMLQEFESSSSDPPQAIEREEVGDDRLH
jgi:hypothetical protein